MRKNNNGGKKKHYPEKLRNKIDNGEGADKVAAAGPAAAPLGADLEACGHTPTSKEVEMAMTEEMKPMSLKAQGPEQYEKSYYAEASLTKKITIFLLTTVLILIALGLIYAYWPLGTPR